MIAFVPEAHTLLIVVAIVDSDNPAPIAHWRAGFWPRLQWVSRTANPMIDRSILCGQDISEKDFLHFFWLDLRYAFDSSYN